MDDDDGELLRALAMSLQPAAGGGGALPSATNAVDIAVAELRRNPATVLVEQGTLKTLATLLGNLAHHPEEEKYCRVRLANPKIATALAGVPGAVAVLQAIGFTTFGEHLEVPREDRIAAAGRAQHALGLLQAPAATAAPPSDWLAGQLCHGNGGAVRCVCFLLDGRIATGGADNVIRIWAAVDDPSPQFLCGHEAANGVSGILALACGPTGLLASGGRDGVILLWDPVSGRQEATLPGHGEGVDVTNAHSVSCLVFCQRTGRLVSGGWDKTARVWDSPLGTSPAVVLRGHSVAVNAVAVLTEAGLVVSASGDMTLRLWREVECIVVIEGGRSPVRAVVAVEQHGIAFASVTNDGAVRTWSSDGSLLRTEQASSTYLFAVAHCPVTGALLTAGDAGEVRRWVLPALTAGDTLLHPASVHCLAIQADGGLAVGSGDGTVYVWTREPSRQAPPALQTKFQTRVALMHSADSADVPALPVGRYDFSFPVELQGGRRLQLNWNRGDRAEVVAHRFVEANGLSDSHLTEVLSFIAEAEAASAPTLGQPTDSQRSFDFTYPVEVADGRRLQLQWNRVDHAPTVAMAFALQHGIPSEELPDIIAFIQQVQGASPSAPVGRPAPMRTAAERTALLQELLLMGFGERPATEALEATQWVSVAAAVDKILAGF
eukprot:GGOE01037272.1.p1 GENE.GGOE01037272.1~~GGOE01037272.1.p1  ORF type:complete len:670 (-),score=161.46 GGOE01037272.1:148-2136(-)